MRAMPLGRHATRRIVLVTGVRSPPPTAESRRHVRLRSLHPRPSSVSRSRYHRAEPAPVSEQIKQVECFYAGAPQPRNQSASGEPWIRCRRAA
jgi:hypothetical protein